MRKCVPDGARAPGLTGTGGRRHDRAGSSACPPGGVRKTSRGSGSSSSGRRHDIASTRASPAAAILGAVEAEWLQVTEQFLEHARAAVAHVEPRPESDRQPMHRRRHDIGCQTERGERVELGLRRQPGDHARRRHRQAVAGDEVNERPREQRPYRRQVRGRRAVQAARAKVVECEPKRRIEAGESKRR